MNMNQRHRHDYDPDHEQLRLDLELAESINVSSGLTEWEANFVDSILKQLNDDRALSEKQRAVAKKIQRELDDGRIGL